MSLRVLVLYIPVLSFVFRYIALSSLYFSFIFEIFEKVNIRFETKNYFLEIVDKILNHVTNEGMNCFFSLPP
jgi:hypothetical protein